MAKGTSTKTPKTEILPRPVPTTCLETAYGTTVRLSFQIKVF